MIKGMWNTYAYMTSYEPQPEEQSQNAPFEGSVYSGYAEKLDKVRSANNDLIVNERIDPSAALQKRRNHIADFDVNDYLFENNNPNTNSSFAVGMESKDDYFLKTECYYLIQFEQVFGTLYLKKDRLEFVPSKDLEKNESLINHDEGDVEAQLDEYAGVIDYLDIIEVNKMNLVNEKAIVSDDSFIREAFKFNLFL